MSEEEPQVIKRGRPKKTTKFQGLRMSDEEIVRIKGEIVNLLETEQAYNLTEACDKLEISKLQVHSWGKTDKDWAALVKVADKIKADRLEKLLFSTDKERTIAWMFLLKKLNPEYRENYKIELSTSESLEKLLKELKQVAEASQKLSEEPK